LGNVTSIECKRSYQFVIDPDHVAWISPFAIRFHGGSLSIWRGATEQICESLFASSDHQRDRNALRDLAVTDEATRVPTAHQV
jgi:hypothetical protein